ncbi:MAG TPA: hypothetical protein QKA14_00855 [Candidatus Megaira endosymbiont of Hartmannula sinica]|nr:hypothetical protein [Candidatus Megaera endosymbiont of Hartmannula sinica]
MKKYIITTALSSLLISSPAAYASKVGDIYGKIGVGMNFASPMKEFFNGTNLNSNNNYLGYVGVGYQMTDKVRLEIGVDHLFGAKFSLPKNINSETIIGDSLNKIFKADQRNASPEEIENQIQAFKETLLRREGTINAFTSLLNKGLKIIDDNNISKARVDQAFGEAIELAGQEIAQAVERGEFVVDMNQIINLINQANQVDNNVNINTINTLFSNEALNVDNINILSNALNNVLSNIQQAQEQEEQAQEEQVEDQAQEEQENIFSQLNQLDQISLLLNSPVGMSKLSDIKVSANYKATTVLAKAYYDIPVNDKFTFFVGAGLGASFNSGDFIIKQGISVDNKFANGGEYSLSLKGNFKTQVSPAGAAYIGVSTKISDSMFFDLEGSYTYYGHTAKVDKLSASLARADSSKEIPFNLERSVDLLKDQALNFVRNSGVKVPPVAGAGIRAGIRIVF